MRAWLKRHVTFINRPSRHHRRGIGFSYARPGGGPILKAQSSWRHINGIWVNTSRWQLWIEFRRIFD